MCKRMYTHERIEYRRKDPGEAKVVDDRTSFQGAFLHDNKCAKEEQKTDVTAKHLKDEENPFRSILR